jgi:hypothetical protein
MKTIEVLYLVGAVLMLAGLVWTWPKRLRTLKHTLAVLFTVLVWPLWAVVVAFEICIYDHRR